MKNVPGAESRQKYDGAGKTEGKPRRRGRKKTDDVSAMPRYEYYTVLKSGMQGQNVCFYVKKAGQRSHRATLPGGGRPAEFSVFIVFSLHRGAKRSIIDS